MTYYKGRQNGRKYNFSREEIEKTLKDCNSQKEAAKKLGVSQMTVSRFKRHFQIVHDGKVLANKSLEKIKKTKESIRKMKNVPGYIHPNKGRKVPKETGKKISEKLKGKIPWNKGFKNSLKSKSNKTYVCKFCDKSFITLKSKNRKFCSKECSSKYFEITHKGGKFKKEKNPNYKNGDKLKQKWKSGCFNNRKQSEKLYTTGKKIEEFGVVFRSSWEYEYAKFLNKNMIKWEYEPKRFILKEGGYYTPDFYLIEEERFVEIKGYWWKKSKERFERFRKEYPMINIEVINEEIWKN